MSIQKSDIVSRLRGPLPAGIEYSANDQLLADAANEIERLRATPNPPDQTVLIGLRGLATRACEARLRYHDPSLPHDRVTPGQHARQMDDLWGWCESLTRLAMKLAEDLDVTQGHLDLLTAEVDRPALVPNERYMRTDDNSQDVFDRNIDLSHALRLARQRVADLEGMNSPERVHSLECSIHAALGLLRSHAGTCRTPIGPLNEAISELNRALGYGE